MNRDPLGENGGLNLYAFVGNDSMNSVDYLGLIGIRTVASGGPGSSNCLGGAMTGENDKFAYPDNNITNPGLPYAPDKKTSFKQALEHEGYQCFEVKNKSDCKCKCEEEKILITLLKTKTLITRVKILGPILILYLIGENLQIYMPSGETRGVVMNTPKFLIMSLIPKKG